MGFMKVLLISMPWASLHRPSLALGVLDAAAKRCQHSHKIDQFYANIRWVEYTMQNSGGTLGASEFTRIADGYFLGAGEWVFTNALYDVKEWKLKEFCAFGEEQGLDSDELVRMHELAPSFIQNLAEEISSKDYDMIGFTSSFLQNVPSLALARKIKEINPEKLIAFGGANCDGVQGIALHKNFSFVDFVIRGEGENAFKDLLDALESKSSLEAIGGLCWRDSNGISIVNNTPAAPVNMNEVPPPDYSEFFGNLENSPVSRWIEPELILEASRGCWWGAKHQCTFCGLNGSFIDYRSKNPEVFLEELEQAVNRYRVLDISFADNILDMTYFKSLLPKMAKLDWDLRMFVEIKANITPDQVSLLREAGFVAVQPGIESLNSKVLRIMDKGVKGAQNVRLLRNCALEGVTVNWNYLYGFPGECDEDYTMIVKQIPALVHLRPPVAATRVALERFSPYFNNPKLGMDNWGPANIYSYIYNLPKEELQDLVYIFESPECGLKGLAEQELILGVQQWQKLHKDSSLNYRLINKNLLIIDRRKGWPEREIVLLAGGEAEAYLALMNGYSISSLANVLIKKHGIDIKINTLESYLESWMKDGLIFFDSEHYVALATEGYNFMLTSAQQEVGSGV